MSNLVSTIMDQLKPSIVENLVTTLGDESQQITDTVQAGIPALLSGIIQKSCTTDGLGAVLHAAREANGENLMEHSADLFSGAGSWSHKANDLMQSIFGGEEHTVVQGISDSTGAKKSSVSGILRMILPLVLAWLGKQVADKQMDNRGFAAQLSSLLPGLAALLPAALSWKKLGLKDPDALKHGMDAVAYNLSGATGPHAVPLETHPAPEEKKSGMGWLLPLLLGLLTVAALWYLLKPKDGSNTTAVAVEDTTAPAAVAADTTRKPLTLPDGTVLPFSKGTMEYKLLEFMADAGRAAGKDVWFDFDDVNFDLGSAKITKESDVQLNNIAQIFKAFPAMTAKVGGYTDRSGDSIVNQKLSQDRADAVMAELLRLGVPQKQLLGAEGYGSQFATVPASEPEDRRRVDRRMSLSIRSK